MTVADPSVRILWGSVLLVCAAVSGEDCTQRTKAKWDGQYKVRGWKPSDANLRGSTWEARLASASSVHAVTDICCRTAEVQYLLYMNQADCLLQKWIALNTIQVRCCTLQKDKVYTPLQLMLSYVERRSLQHKGTRLAAWLRTRAFPGEAA